VDGIKKAKREKNWMIKAKTKKSLRKKRRNEEGK